MLSGETSLDTSRSVGVVCFLLRLTTLLTMSCYPRRIDDSRTFREGRRRVGRRPAGQQQGVSRDVGARRNGAGAQPAESCDGR